MHSSAFRRGRIIEASPNHCVVSAVFFPRVSDKLRAQPLVSWYTVSLLSPSRSSLPRQLADGARRALRRPAGKGVAPSPRRTASYISPGRARAAFGFHRAADSAGAVIGPAIGLGLFELLSHHYRPVFIIAAIPAVLGVVALFFIPERKPKVTVRAEGDPTPPAKLGRRFYIFLAISLLFAFGNSSDAFLILRSENLGLTTTATVSAYILYTLVYTLGSFRWHRSDPLWAPQHHRPRVRDLRARLSGLRHR